MPDETPTPEPTPTPAPTPIDGTSGDSGNHVPTPPKKG